MIICCLNVDCLLGVLIVLWLYYSYWLCLFGYNVCGICLRCVALDVFDFVVFRYLICGCFVFVFACYFAFCWVDIWFLL